MKLRKNLLYQHLLIVVNLTSCPCASSCRNIVCIDSKVCRVSNNLLKATAILCSEAYNESIVRSRHSNCSRSILNGSSLETVIPVIAVAASPLSIPVKIIEF